jgi:hypothetical protein
MALGYHLGTLNGYLIWRSIPGRRTNFSYVAYLGRRAAISVDLDASDEIWTAAVNPVPDDARPDILSKFAEAMRETRARNRAFGSLLH